MHELVPIIAIIMGCLWLSGALQTLARKLPAKGDREVLEELGKLRSEIQQLRTENHDLILGFDSTLRSVERRLERVEHDRVLPSAASPAAATDLPYIGGGR